jgi:hypothetical protein
MLLQVTSSAVILISLLALAGWAFDIDFLKT